MKRIFRLVQILSSFLPRGLRIRNFRKVADALEFSGEFTSGAFPIPPSHYYSGKSPEDNFRSIFAGYLREVDWVKSRASGFSAIGDELVPWTTYPLVRFLEKWDISKERVLEFGGGASTHWFSSRAKSLVTYEFDDTWAEALRSSGLPSSVEVRSTDRGLRDAPDKIRKHEMLMALAKRDMLEIQARPNPTSISDLNAFVEMASFESSLADVILVDGGYRNLILGIVAAYAREHAVVIVDNSDWEYLADGISALKASGFVEIPFRGLGPINAYEFQSSIFVSKLQSLARVSGQTNEETQ